MTATVAVAVLRHASLSFSASSAISMSSQLNFPLSSSPSGSSPSLQYSRFSAYSSHSMFVYVQKHRRFLVNGLSFSRKRLVVFARRLSGLEEAMRINKLRENQVVTKSSRKVPLKRGRVSPTLPVPDDIPRPPYAATSMLPEIAKEYQFPGSEGIEAMRAACELAARVLENAGKLVRPSVTTNEIDKVVHQMIIDAGAYPSPLGYGGFPKSVCTSVNECMCHGIPDSRQLQDGGIINIDVTVYLNGYHGDTSKTFLCGEVSDGIQRLVKVTEECLERGIAVCKDVASFKKIGKKISEHAEKYGFGVVERFVGHGVGTIFHSEPLILHHRNDQSGSMVEGQTFTIEPSLTMGIGKHQVCNMARQLDNSNRRW